MSSARWPDPGHAEAAPGCLRGGRGRFVVYDQGMAGTAEKKIVTAVPDLRDFPLDRIAELGGSPLARSIALYRERLKENGVPLSSFNARI